MYSLQGDGGGDDVGTPFRGEVETPIKYFQQTGMNNNRSFSKSFLIGNKIFTGRQTNKGYFFLSHTPRPFTSQPAPHQTQALVDASGAGGYTICRGGDLYPPPLFTILYQSNP